MSTEAQKKASMKWEKDNYHRFSLTMPNDYYYNRFLPFIQKHGYTMRGFILESIERNMTHIEESKGDA